MDKIIHFRDLNFGETEDDDIKHALCGLLVYPADVTNRTGFIQSVNCVDCLKVMKRNRLINDGAPGWDDRKHVLDIYYANGGKLGNDISLRDNVYEGLLAVARYSAERMYDWLEEEKEL